jgi:uncharacterized protein (DUF1778 family)
MAAVSHRSNAPGETKRERMELRVASSTKAMIKRAMAVSGMTAGDLAYEGALRVLEDHERMVLASADAAAFLKAVAAPPKPTDRLVKALQKHKSVAG